MEIIQPNMELSRDNREMHLRIRDVSIAVPQVQIPGPQLAQVEIGFVVDLKRNCGEVSNRHIRAPFEGQVYNRHRSCGDKIGWDRALSLS